jgi:CheY-like chemotaxis protein
VSERAFDLRRLLEGLEDMFRLRADQKGLAFELDFDPGLPRFVLADESKVRQILMNLLGNSVKFTKQGGVILRARRAAATAEPTVPAGAVVDLLVEVEDSGPGLTEDELRTIFIPFVQSTAGIEAQEGTGLGLAISQQFARLLGGDLTAESAPGRGSVFRLRLPVRAAAAGELTHPEPSRQVVGLEPGQPEKRLLVVDDSEVNRKLLVRLFQPLGLPVREARHGVEALRIWEDWAPHLIWMDMRMPVMDGYEATRRIKATTQGQATVIIALTASALEEDRTVILSEGCDDYIRKPFRESDLFEMLVKHLGLRFVYREVETEPSPAAALDREELVGELAGLPAEWRGDLKRASLLGYPEEIARMLQVMRSTAPQVVEWLDRMAQAFDHQAILEALAEAEKLHE